MAVTAVWGADYVEASFVTPDDDAMNFVLHWKVDLLDDHAPFYGTTVRGADGLTVAGAPSHLTEGVEATAAAWFKHQLEGLSMAPDVALDVTDEDGDLFRSPLQEHLDRVNADRAERWTLTLPAREAVEGPDEESVDPWDGALKVLAEAGWNNNDNRPVGTPDRLTAGSEPEPADKENDDVERADTDDSGGAPSRTGGGIDRRELRPGAAGR